MNKPLIVGGAVAGTLRGIALGLCCLTCVGLGSLAAQQTADELQASASVSTAFSAKPTAATSPTANANWRNSNEAALALKAEVARLSASSAGTAQAEAQVSITREYYTAVLDRVGQTGDVPTAYTNSYIDLLRAAERFPSGSRPDYSVVRRNLLTLLTR